MLASSDVGVLDVLASTAGRKPTTPGTQGMWEKVTAEVRAHRGRASVLSMEFLSYADSDQAAAILSATAIARSYSPRWKRPRASEYWKLSWNVLLGYRSA